MQISFVSGKFFQRAVSSTIISLNYYGPGLSFFIHIHRSYTAMV